MEKIKTQTNIFKQLTLLAILLISVTAWAAPKIVNVDFVGLSQVSENTVRARLSSIEGRVFSDAALDEDIKKIYATNFFSDVYVTKKNVSGGVHVTFHVREKGTISQVSFEGNKKIKTKALQQAVSIRAGEPVDDRQLAQARQAILKLYEDKSFSLVDVAYDIVSGASGEQNLVFHIFENDKVRIKRISFLGNKIASDKKLAGQMLTKVKGLFSFLSGGGKLKSDKLAYDVEKLKFFYMDQGYLKARIGEPQVSFTKDHNSIYITIPVFEGEKFEVANVDVTGDIITTKAQLLKNLKLKSGDVFKVSNEQEDIRDLVTLYGDQSYAFAEINPIIDADDVTKKANVTYNIKKGYKVFVERIEIKGNTVTRDKVIRREIQLVENSPFNRSELDRSQRRIMQLGYFEDVKLAIPHGSAPDRVTLVVEVKEKPTGSFNIGAGFSSLESFILTANVQKDNFLGYGIRGSVSANLSKLRQEFSVSMTDRYFLDTRWIVAMSAHRYASALNQDFDQESFGGTVSFGRELFHHVDMSLGYKIEDVSITNFSSQVPGFFQRNASGLTSSVISTVAVDTRDNRLQTSKGMYHSVSGEYSGNGIGGDNDYWKLFAESRVYAKLPLKTILKARGMFAYVNSLNDGPVPLFERFFLGGVNTLRGFDTNTIGPKLKIPKSATSGDSSFTYGGNRMVLFNLEFELPVYDPAGLRAVLFADSGQSFSETESIDLSRFRSNYGVGLRWNSPFGPLRFEWGFPFKRESGESFSVFNFTIGQSF